MKRIVSIFIALSLCTLPCFATAEQSATCTTAANAQTAVLKKIGNTMVCVPTECICGYEIKDNECIKPETKKCTHDDPDAYTAHEVFEVINGECKKICRIKTCKSGFIKNDSDQCIKKTKGSNEPTTPQERDNTDKSKIKGDVKAKFCKEEWLNFTDKCDDDKPTVIAGCKEYIREARNELKNALKNYCFKNKTNVVEIDDEKTNTKKLEEAKKQEAINAQKKQCETNDNGKWDDKKGKCNCKSGLVLDNDGQCVQETQAAKNAKEKLTALKSALDDVVKEIEKNQTQP